MSDTASSRTVLVTGSSRGIGRAVALSLADAGYDVVVHCRASRAQAEEVCREIEAKGRKARLLAFDVTDRQAAREALEADCEAHGAYWGVVLNAGIHRDAPLVGLEEDDWDSVLKTDLDAFYNVLKPVLLPMCRKRRGRVVVMSSVSSAMTFFMNRILMGFTSTAAAFFGVYIKLQSFVFMPVFGLNNGMVPIIGPCCTAPSTRCSPPSGTITAPGSRSAYTRRYASPCFTRRR